MQGPERTYRLREQKLSWRQVGDEVVVLDLERSVYLSLNASGRDLWLRLATGASVPDLAAALQDEFDLSADRAEQDARAFLDDLVEQGLVV